MSVSVAIHKVAKGCGDGPHWDEKSQSLLYVDIHSGAVHRWNSVTGVNETVTLDDTVSFVVPRKAGGYLVGLGRTISSLDWDTKQVTKWHEVEVDTKNRFNDAKCDASGRLWAGTMGYIAPGTLLPEPGVAHLYSLAADRSLKKHLDKIDLSNGLAWTADNSTLYYIDSIPRKVYAFDFDINQGTIKNQRTAVNFGEGTIPTLGYPDGMCIDVEGKLWVGCFGAGKVIRFDPETGKQLQTIHIPAQLTTSCCFGGENYDELYVMSSAWELTADDWKKTPDAGSVFKVKGLGVKGTAPYEYVG